MKPDELLAAADLVVVGAYKYPGDDCVPQAIMTAADELATHIQRMYDPTPVDRNWWLSAAGAQEILISSGAITLDATSKYVLVLGCGYHVAATLKTRGDVRRLCEVMGIELREGT